jgi:hypothetical protein
MSAEETREGATVDPPSGGTVGSLTDSAFAGVAALTPMPKVADAATVDLRKLRKGRSMER